MSGSSSDTNLHQENERLRQRVSELSELLHSARVGAGTTSVDRLADVITRINERLDGMIARPGMYGTPQSLEMEFLTLLELKEISLGLPDEGWMHNRWREFIDAREGGTRSLSLSGRREMWELNEFVAFLHEFRGQVGL